MASMIAYDQYDCVLGSRILGNGARKGGMPLYKYISNRFLTLIENLLIGPKLSEYHTGYRAWSRAVIERLPLLSCSDDFVFDNQMIVQAVYFGFRFGEISCPTRYFEAPRRSISGAAWCMEPECAPLRCNSCSRSGSWPIRPF